MLSLVLRAWSALQPSGWTVAKWGAGELLLCRHLVWLPCWSAERQLAFGSSTEMLLLQTSRLMYWIAFVPDAHWNLSVLQHACHPRWQLVKGFVCRNDGVPMHNCWASYTLTAPLLCWASYALTACLLCR